MCLLRLRLPQNVTLSNVCCSNKMCAHVRPGFRDVRPGFLSAIVFNCEFNVMHLAKSSILSSTQSSLVSLIKIKMIHVYVSGDILQCRETIVNCPLEETSLRVRLHNVSSVWHHKLSGILIFPSPTHRGD